MTDRFVAITGYVVGNAVAGFDVEYAAGVHYADKAEAVADGYAQRHTDDFLVGVVRDGRLAEIWHLDERLDTDARTGDEHWSQEDVADVAKSLGLMPPLEADRG